MPLHQKFTVYIRLGTYLFLLSAFTISSCTKSATNPKPLDSDSVYLINSLSLYLGGDSTNWNVSTRDTFAFDSSQNQLIQTIAESTFGVPLPDVYQTVYQYDNANRLQGVTLHKGAYKLMSFQYSESGDIEKAFFTDGYDAVIQNDFEKHIENGNTVITQYDTLASNMGKGDYFSSRPAIVKYTFNSAGKLINRYSICSEMYNGELPYHDTLESRLVYDENNHLATTTNRYIMTDNQHNMIESLDTMQFNRGDSPLTPVNDLAMAVLRNLDWLTTCDNLTLFNCLYSVQYGNLSREEPIISTYEVFSDRNYAASYINTFNSLGLLTKSSLSTTEHNIYNPGTSTHETHYFGYLKIKK